MHYKPYFYNTDGPLCCRAWIFAVLSTEWGSFHPWLYAYSSTGILKCGKFNLDYINWFQFAKVLSAKPSIVLGLFTKHFYCQNFYCMEFLNKLKLFNKMLHLICKYRNDVYHILTSNFYDVFWIVKKLRYMLLHYLWQLISS